MVDGGPGPGGDPGSYLRGIAERDREPTADGTLRVAVVGLGWWTREFALPALAAAPNCEPTVAVSGSDEKRAAATAERERLERGLSYEEYAAGEASGAYDAVYVCTPNATHLEHVETAADLGKAVLCEKPMEATPERAAALVAACEDAEVPLMVGYRLQTDPAVRRMREMVRDGLLGTPLQVHGHMSQPLLDLIPDPDQWRLDPDLAGPGASVTDLGVYPLNTTRFLLGEDPASVTASMRSEGDAFASVPDEYAEFTVAFESGLAAQCSVSQNAQLTGHLRIVGSDGELALEPAFFGGDEQRLTLRLGEETRTATWTPDDQMRLEFEHFAEQVLAGDPVEPDGEHALVDVATVDAVYEAAERGRPVTVPASPG